MSLVMLKGCIVLLAGAVCRGNGAPESSAPGTAPLGRCPGPSFPGNEGIVFVTGEGHDWQARSFP